MNSDPAKPDTLENALQWLLGLPPEYLVDITRTFRMGEENGRNWIGVKSARYADICISIDKPYANGDGVGRSVAFASEDTLLDAIQAIWQEWQTAEK